jgi:hypothetical protein
MILQLAALLRLLLAIFCKLLTLIKKGFWMSRLDARSLKKFWVDEVPTGAVNGSNTTFTLAQMPLEAEAVDVYLNGLKQIPGTDYSVSGVDITFTTAPAVGQILRVEYIRLRGE